MIREASIWAVVIVALHVTLWFCLKAYAGVL
jgi:hypothetical protein